MSDNDLSTYSAVLPGKSQALEGSYVRLAPLDTAVHAGDLFLAGHAGTRAETAERWRYMSGGPFEDEADMASWCIASELSPDYVTYVLIDELTGKPRGMASYMRIDPANGVIEIGSIWFGAELQRTRAATEAIYLLAEHAFETLGYRRLEWKCNNDNAASKAAALRFGFTFEGVFRQHMIVKGLNRDTAWFSITHSEWPGIEAGFRSWLQADNFDGDRRQIKSLHDCRTP